MDTTNYYHSLNNAVLLIILPDNAILCGVAFVPNPIWYWRCILDINSIYGYLDEKMVMKKPKSCCKIPTI
jgi:hypothetical protein